MIPQRDVLHDVLTLDRALWYTAKLRLPADASRADIDARIAEMLEGRRDQFVAELAAQAVDHTDVPIDGGYDRSGKGRMGVTIGLSVALAWPFVFLKGKNVFLEPGTYQVYLRMYTDLLRAGSYQVYAGLMDRSLMQIEDYRTFDLAVADPDGIRSPAVVRARVDWDTEGTFFS